MLQCGSVPLGVMLEKIVGMTERTCIIFNIFVIVSRTSQVMLPHWIEAQLHNDVMLGYRNGTSVSELYLIKITISLWMIHYHLSLSRWKRSNRKVFTENKRDYGELLLSRDEKVQRWTHKYMMVRIKNGQSPVSGMKLCQLNGITISIYQGIHTLVLQVFALKDVALMIGQHFVEFSCFFIEWAAIERGLNVSGILSSHFSSVDTTELRFEIN